jgi:hypothetical protein
MPGVAPNLVAARGEAAAIDAAMNQLRGVSPTAGSYVSDSNYFQQHWQTAFWGSHYPRLAAIKRKYDPHGLFFAWHGVGSEEWN